MPAEAGIHAFHPAVLTMGDGRDNVTAVSCRLKPASTPLTLQR
jgi:hypothetical protein